MSPESQNESRKRMEWETTGRNSEIKFPKFGKGHINLQTLEEVQQTQTG